jgi:hypothetical protein
MAPTSIAIQRPNETGFENRSAQCSARFFLVAIPSFAGCTFVHIASFPSKEKQAILTELAAFKAFQKELKDRCDEQPDAQPLTEVGS